MKFDFDKCIKDGVEQAMKECELTIGMTLKEALEKQIPTKGSIKYLSSYTDDPPVLLCPNCQEHIPTEGCNFYKYCYNCGQKIDWSDTE